MFKKTRNKLNPNEIQKIEHLFQKYRALMHYIANNILVDKNLAEDAVSESFEKIINNLDKIDIAENAKTKAFIAIITKNTAINIYNAAKKLTNFDEWETLPDESSNVETAVIGEETYSNILNLVNELPQIYREILILHLFNELSYKEIAESLNISYNLAKKRAYRAKSMLIKQLQDGGGKNDEI
ncbi:MAG: sigma-70 family RNA polymerase sigma factor [Firmicutes bacterium]|nr:sigma-70 family RNA polymerase sigma factor [Bacillota bacterium]